MGVPLQESLLRGIAMKDHDVKIAAELKDYQEFLDYDGQGNPVVLRRSTSHPGMSEAEANALQAEDSAVRASGKELFQQSLGQGRLFGSARDVLQWLRGKQD